MKMRIRILRAASAMFACALVLVSAAAVNAQGRYANVYSRADVSNIITQLEQSSDTFRRNFDNAMDNSPINGTADERRYNGYVSNYENSLDRLRRDYDRFDSWWESRNNVQNVLRDARPVNDMMNTISFRRNLERQWNRMRDDINKLADTFDLPGLAGGGWTGGGGGFPGESGPTTNPPAWARGTFYSAGGQGIMLTINANGRVTATVGGQTYYGRYYRGQLYLNNDVSTVSRRGNGIRTYNRNLGQTIDYSREGWGGGGPGWPGDNGPMSNPPSWAQGTFYSTGGQGITMTISSNGQVTVVNAGQTFYGRYYRGQIYLNNDVSTVSRLGNGIRTYNRSQGLTTDYSRDNWGGGGGFPGEGGATSTPPNWAQGTFYSPGRAIQMTIDRNGRVTVINAGVSYYGTYYQGAITLNNDVSTVTRISNGIRTYNRNTGQYTNYTRTGR